MHSTVTDAPAAEPERCPGAAARLGNLLVDPPEAFRGISNGPAWALAFVVIVVVRFVSLFVFYHPQGTPAKILAGIAFQVAAVLPALLVTGSVLWLSSVLWRSRIAWPVAFSIGTHAYLAYTLATVAAASVAGALLAEGSAVDLRHPPFTNLAPLASESTHPALARLLAEVDLRTAYTLLLAWVGVRAAAPLTGRLRAAGMVAVVALARLVFSVAVLR